jgi:hypothetical protein
MFLGLDWNGSEMVCVKHPRGSRVEWWIRTKAKGKHWKTIYVTERRYHALNWWFYDYMKSPSLFSKPPRGRNDF